MELIQISLETTIEEALLSARLELLPKEMAEDELTLWIADFDQLNKQERHEHSISDEKHQNEDEFLDFFISPIIQNTLTPKISFYFASLFHIGRQWQVAQYAAETASEAQLLQNLEKTAEINLEVFHNDFEELDVALNDRRSVLLDSIRGILSYSEKQHLEKINKAKELWTIWKDEVRGLRSVIDECSEVYEAFKSNKQPFEYRYLRFPLWRSLCKVIFFSVEQHSLYQNLIQDGVQFKSTTDYLPDRLTLMHLPLLAFILINDDPRWFWETSREYRDILHQQEELIKQQRFASIMQFVEAQLLELFRTNNPFQRYEVLHSPPDRELKKLWNECVLPDGTMFYYAKKWRNSLDVTPYYGDVPFNLSLTEEEIKTHARSADSFIKSRWVDYPSWVGDTDRERIQRLFKEWIGILAFRALSPTRNNTGYQSWNVNSFKTLVRRVTTLLTSCGYSLTAPTLKSLNALWRKASQKDSHPNKYKDTW